jgi:hypothetical protein
MSRILRWKIPPDQVVGRVGDRRGRGRACGRGRGRGRSGMARVVGRGAVVAGRARGGVSTRRSVCGAGRVGVTARARPEACRVVTLIGPPVSHSAQEEAYATTLTATASRGWGGPCGVGWWPTPRSATVSPTSSPQALFPDAGSARSAAAGRSAPCGPGRWPTWPAPPPRSGGPRRPSPRADTGGADRGPGRADDAARPAAAGGGTSRQRPGVMRRCDELLRRTGAPSVGRRPLDDP